MHNATELGVGNSLNLERGTIVKVQPRADDLGAAIRRAADWAGDLAKIAAVVSSILATVLLLAYLHSMGAPIPSLDSSIAVTLSFMGVSFTWFLIVFWLTLFLPLFYKAIMANQVRRIFPDLFCGNILSGAYFSAYLRFFRPFLLMAIVLYGFIIALIFRPGTDHRWVILSLVAGCIELILLACEVRGKFAAKWSMAFIVESGIQTIFSYLWLLVCSLILAVIGRQLSVPAIVAVILVCIVAIVLVGFHFLICALRSLTQIAGISCAAISLLLIFPGPPFLGGSVLRYLGIGGSLPVILTVGTRSGVVQHSEESIKACLILALGSDVLFVRAHRREDCKLDAQFLPFANAQHTLAPYDQVERYARSQVLRISNFPNSTKP
jgi:hypothetical protein